MRADLHAQLRPEAVTRLRLVGVGNALQEFDGARTHAAAQVDDEAGREAFEGEEGVLEHVQVQRVDGGLEVVLAGHAVDQAVGDDSCADTVALAGCYRVACGGGRNEWVGCDDLWG